MKITHRQLRRLIREAVSDCAKGPYINFSDIVKQIERQAKNTGLAESWGPEFVDYMKEIAVVESACKVVDGEIKLTREQSGDIVGYFQLSKKNALAHLQQAPCKNRDESGIYKVGSETGKEINKRLGHGGDICGMGKTTPKTKEAKFVFHDNRSIINPWHEQSIKEIISTRGLYIAAACLYASYRLEKAGITDISSLDSRADAWAKGYNTKSDKAGTKEHYKEVIKKYKKYMNPKPKK